MAGGKYDQSTQDQSTQDLSEDGVKFGPPNRSGSPGWTERSVKPLPHSVFYLLGSELAEIQIYPQLPVSGLETRLELHFHDGFTLN